VERGIVKYGTYVTMGFLCLGGTAYIIGVSRDGFRRRIYVMIQEFNAYIFSILLYLGGAIKSISTSQVSTSPSPSDCSAVYNHLDHESLSP
jgi:hypothetical protein